jgi:hypothetical protein
MRRTSVALVTLAAGLVWSGPGIAADQTPPTISNLRASPSKFCAKKTRTCRHDGTHVRFTVSTNATVRGDIRERRALTGSFVEFVKKLKKGKNDVYLHDKRLHPGKWTIRVQGTNSVGSGGVDTVDVRVVKHD